MSKRDRELFLFDILIAILKIKDYTKEFDNGLDLKHNCKSWDAVIREFEVIGEATNNLIKLNHFNHEEREIVDFRNILIHEYFGIDENEVWNIIDDFLDPYKIEIQNHIAGIDPSLRKNYVEQLIEEYRYADFIASELEKLH